MLEIIWFILWTLLWAVYFILDGFDLGLGSLMPFITRNENDRRLIYKASGPYWDGNEVWLISAGGITFAAFPKVYAVMFSALYAPLLILLFALILRAASYEFRDKVESAAWRSFWDAVHFVVNLLACVVLGVFFANLFMGIPVDMDGVYHGTLLGLFNLYGTCGGLFFLLMFMMHGAIWLALKSRGEIQTKALAAAGMLWVGVGSFLLIFLILTAFYTDIYANYFRYPWLCVIPLLAVLALLMIPKMLNNARLLMGWLCSAVFILCVTFFGVLGIFPNMIISSLDATFNITAFNGSSTQLTLEIMLWIALVMVPIVLLYQLWMYHLFAKPINATDSENGGSY